jgi:hypothetical protein
MGVKVASIFAEIGLDSSKLKSGAAGANSTIAGLVKGIGGLNPVVAGMITVLGGLATYLNAAGKEAGRFAEISAKQEAILRATGSAAGLAAHELDGMARELSKTTELQVSAVKEAQSMMLTFRNIGEETFPRAMQAAADLQTTFGSLNESVKQVSMAANDFDGYTRLQRSGVTFSEEQRKQIKLFKETNDLIGYQDLLLTEIERQVGGTAAAIAAAGDGTGRYNASLEVLNAEIGRGVLPLQQAWNNALADAVDRLAELVKTERDYYDIKRQATAAAREGKEEIDDSAMSFSRYGRSVRVSGEEIRYHTAMIERQNSYMALGESQLKALGVQFESVGDIVAETAQDYKELIGLTDSISKNTQDFADRQADLTAKMEENRAEAEKLYPWQHSELERLNDQYAEMGEQYSKNADEHKAASDRILYDLLLQKLSVDGLTEAEYEMALAYGQSVGIFDEASANMARAMNSVTEAVEDGRLKVEDMKSALALMAAGNYDIDMAVRITETRARGYDYSMLASEHRAAGGPVGAGRPYIVGERGPEMFVPGQSGQIVPNSQMGGGIDYDRLGDAVAQAMARSGLIQ